MEHVGGHHTHRHTIDALAGQVLVVDHLAPARTCMLEKTREIGPRKRIGSKANRNQRQRPAHGAARGLQQGQEQDGAHDDIHRVGVADPKRQIVKHIGDVEHTGCASHGQQPVDHRHATQAPALRGCSRGFVVTSKGCKDQKDQAQHKSQVHTSVGGLAQQTKPCRVVMETRQDDEQPFDDHRGRRCRRTETHFRVKFLFQFLQLAHVALADIGHAFSPWPGPSDPGSAFFNSQRPPAYLSKPTSL